MEPSLRPALGSVVDGASSHSGWEQMLATRKLITCRNYEFQGDKRDIKLKGIHNKTPERREQLERWLCVVKSTNCSSRGPVPRAHIRAHHHPNSGFRDRVPPSDLCRQQACLWCTQVHTGKACSIDVI